MNLIGLKLKNILLAGFFFVLLACPNISFANTGLGMTLDGYGRIFYYREGKEARASFFAHYSSIDVIAPQSYSIDSAGTLKGKVDPDVLQFALNKKIKVMPLVTNKGFSKSEAEAFFDNPSLEDSAVNALVAEAKAKNFSGWQLDFEQISSSYKDKFSNFVKNFGDTMKRNGLVSSVAVIAKISDTPTDYKNNLWDNLIGVYDFDALSSSTDFISIMSYDDPDSKGPIARYSWLKKVIGYSLQHIPSEKISLGLAFYYWRWHDASQKRYGIGGYSAMKSYINKYKMIKGYSVAEQAPFMTYKSKGIKYTIWYENAKSISEKLDLAKKNGIGSFSAWAIGLEYPDVYKAVSKWKGQLAVSMK